MGEPEAKAAVQGVTTGAGERDEATIGASSTAGRTMEVPMPGQRADSQKIPFVADRRMAGGSGLEADRILAVRFGRHEDYERVVVDLGTGAEPAKSVPEWKLEGPVESGVLRVTFPSVGDTRVSGGSLDGSLLKSFYVVRSPAEGLFVDFFVREGFRYRVTELPDPARLVMDFRPSGEPLKAPLPARGANTVLVEPRPETRGGGDPFTVSGYSRNPEASNSIVLASSAGDKMVRKTVRSNDWTATWGYFETTLDPPPFEKRATLRVGAPSGRDGTFEGVEVPIRGK